MFGENGAAWSVIYVDIDAHNRNRSILETLLPRASTSKEVEASLLPVISFPAFATHDEKIYSKTKGSFINNVFKKIFMGHPVKFRFSKISANFNGFQYLYNENEIKKL